MYASIKQKNKNFKKENNKKIKCLLLDNGDLLLNAILKSFRKYTEGHNFNSLDPKRSEAT